MTIVVWQYDMRRVSRLADQHTAIRRDLAHQLRLGLLIFRTDKCCCLLCLAAVHDGEAAAPETSATEPRAKDAGGLQEDLVELYHLFAPCNVGVAIVSVLSGTTSGM